MTGDLLDRADLDTWLARVLLHQGRLARETLSPLLTDARAGRAVGGASLARTLVARGLLRRDEVERLLSEGAEAIAGVEEAPAARPKRLAGYELTEVLGAGGMGVVYRARHLETGVDYALKTLTGADAELVARFQREGEGQARLGDHPNVVKVHTLGREEGTCYLVMDLVEGGTLHDRLREGLPAPEIAARWVVDLAHAIERAHQRGVLHRDLKPANVLFDGDVPKLVDFGLAKLLDARSLTQTGAVIGTPGYMAPEQIDASFGPPSPASDVWGLGAVLYHCLTGRAPFVASSTLATVFQVLETAPPALRSLSPEVSQAIEAVCLRCLEKAPQRRYPSAAALSEALEVALVTEDDPGERRWIAVAAAVIGVLVLVVGCVALTLADPSQTLGTATPSPTPREQAPVRVDPGAPEPAWSVWVDGPQAVEIAAIQSGVFAGPTAIRRLELISSAAPGRVPAIALRLLGKLRTTSPSESPGHDPARGLLAVQRAALGGDAEAAAWLGNAHLPAHARETSWPAGWPGGPRPELAHAGLSLALAWDNASPGLQQRARELLGGQGLSPLQPSASYRILWRAWPAARVAAAIEAPSRRDEMWERPMSDELRLRCVKASELFLRIENGAVPRERLREVVGVFKAILHQAPGELHREALLTLAKATSVPVTLYLARAALIGDGRACIGLAVSLDPQLQTQARLFKHPKLSGSTPDPALATLVLQVGSKGIPQRYADAAKRLLEGRPLRGNTSDAYRAIWRRFPNAR